LLKTWLFGGVNVGDGLEVGFVVDDAVAVVGVGDVVLVRSVVGVDVSCACVVVVSVVRRRRVDSGIVE
jgi:small ligand-binding sensory domain FIST